MTRAKYFADRFAALEKDWDAGNFPALASAVAEAHHGGVALPAWAADAVLENLHWAHANKRGAGSPKKITRARIVMRQRWLAVSNAMRRRALANAQAKERRKWEGQDHPRAVTLVEAFKAAPPSGSRVVWTEYKRAWLTIERARKQGEGHLYGL